MKIIVTIAMSALALQACSPMPNRSLRAAENNTADMQPSIESGKRSCDPSKDDYTETRWSGNDHSIADPKKIKVYTCSKELHKWSLDLSLTAKDIAETSKSMAEAKAKADRRQELVHSISSRVIGEKDLADFIGFGTDVFDDPFSVCGGMISCTYSGDYKTMEDAHNLYLSKKFNDLLAQQFKLRAIAAKYGTRARHAALIHGPGCLSSDEPLRSMPCHLEDKQPLGLLPRPSGKIFPNCGSDEYVSMDGHGNYICVNITWDGTAVQTPESAPYPGYYCGSHDCSVKCPPNQYAGIVPNTCAKPN